MRSLGRLAALRSKLHLPVVKRATGLLEGRHRSVFTGHGQDFDDMVDYHPGDDPSDIDWKTSARVGHPVIKRFQRETNLSLILAVDTGRNMAAAAPSSETKAEVAQFAAQVLIFLARGRGDLVGAVTGDAERLTQLPAKQGLAHTEAILSRIADQMSLAAPEPDLNRVLARTLTSVTRRSLVAVITDQAHPGMESELELRRLLTRHEVMMVRVADMIPAQVERGAVVDVSGGELPAFLRRDPVITREAAALVAQRTAQTSQMLRTLGIEQVTVDGSDGVVDALVDLLGRQRRVHR